MSKLVPSRQNVYHIWAPHKLAIWRTQRFSEKNFKPRRNVCHLWANLSRSNEMCTTYEHRMNLPLGGHRDSPEWKNHSQDRDEFRFPHKMRIKKVHSQSEWWYHRVAHVCLRINPNKRWYMRVLRTFRKCSILLPGFDEPVRNWSKLWKTCQKFWGCLENDRFYRESALVPDLHQYLLRICCILIIGVSN